MSFDLRAALLKKEEYETSKRFDFEFRLKARAMKRLAETLGIDAGGFAQRTVTDPIPLILTSIAEATQRSIGDITDLWRAYERTVRLELVAEFGDPAAHPLI